MNDSLCYIVYDTCYAYVMYTDFMNGVAYEGLLKYYSYSTLICNMLVHCRDYVYFISFIISGVAASNLKFFSFKS